MMADMFASHCLINEDTLAEGGFSPTSQATENGVADEKKCFVRNPSTKSDHEALSAPVSR
jgi:hypothetical protein